MMSRRLAVLMIFFSLACPAARAQEKGAKTDLISELHRSYSPQKQPKEDERIRQLQDITGQEWLEVTLGERMDYMMAAMFTLKSYGVAPRKTLNDYCNAVEKMLVRHSDLYDTQLTDILVSVIYEKEPAARPSLDKFKADRAAKTVL